MLNADTLPSNRPKPAFGRWLLEQKLKSGAIGELAAAAARDPKFPRDGSPEDVSAHLNRCMADGDMHEALETAELDWRCY